MIRRNCLAAATVGATFLAMAGGLSSAASAATPGSVLLRCTTSFSVLPPAGSNSVEQPPAGGQMDGPTHCGTKGFGGGLASSSFTVLDDGNWVGTYSQYFSAGSIHGSLKLVPQEGGPVSSNFESESWLGTFTVTGGTGVYSKIKGLKGKKNLGVIRCSSPDTVHLVCHEKTRVTMG